MVTGVEIAGVILGTLPLVVSALEHYAEGVSTIARWWRFKKELSNLVRVLDTEHGRFLNTCELLLSGIVSSLVLERLLDDPGGETWKNAEIERKLKIRLHRDYSSYFKSVKGMADVLQEFRTKLELDGTGNPLWTNYHSFKKEFKRVKFSLQHSQYEELLKKVEKSNDMLANLAGQNLTLEPARLRRWNRPASKFKTIQKQAKNLHMVINQGWTCNCGFPHSADLRLDARLLASEFSEPDQVHFNVVFQTKPRLSDKSGKATLPWTWQETLIRLYDEQGQEIGQKTPQLAGSREPPPSSPSETKSGPSGKVTTQGTDLKGAILPGASTETNKPKSRAFTKTKKSVKFASPTSPPKVGGDQNDPPATGTSMTNLVLIKDLCTAMQRSMLNAVQDPKCLGYLSAEQHQRLAVYLQPLKTQATDHDFLSLTNLFSRDASLKSQFLPTPGSLTLSRGDRLRLGLTLASSVLQLHETSWLPETWGKDHIMINANDMTRLHEQAYVSKIFPITPSLDQRRDTRSMAVFGGKNRWLFGLGIVLIELCFGQTIEALRIPEDPLGDDGKPDIVTSLCTANRLKDTIYNESGTRYGDVVRRCINCDFNQRHTSLDDDAFRQAVYNDVVAELEDEEKLTENPWVEYTDLDGRMGIPKFYRWLSERYPATSQLIAENRIPEFDCLYLDMNGIIHNCTHKDSDSPTFRMTEDKMFIAIFNYIEHLFGKIKPKKLFFMAIDGVAPRAKMNQQRARRFRTALDNEKAKEKAIKEGAEMPTEEAFDSNCITPGTEFMAKLTRQLKYFINKKVSEDVDWQGVEVVLSGHEVPGEGEHKIMEYIRQAKAQPNYEPNVRHCLYGLDADLIMLGLLSHDPHFCLLREEVTFGRANSKKSKELEHQNFFLMHLCILREYLELEFQELKDPSVMAFSFDMEHIIDDFILMAFFVGNDFLPNLPNLHINEGALALMFKVYKSVLPKAGGYINESGIINVGRLSLLLEELSDVEYRFFEAENADASWFKGKQMRKVDVMEKSHKKGPVSVTTTQKEIFKAIKAYVNNRSYVDVPISFDLPKPLPAADRKFVEDLADDLRLQWKTIADDDGERHLRLDFPHKVGNNEDDDEEDDEESQLALLRVIKRYENAKVVDVSVEQAQEEMDKKYEQKFAVWKDKYYKGKFEWGLEDEEEMRKLAENYVQGLQWVLYYYYRGVASWPWFYAYHYSPMISDVKRGLGANMNFELGQPFRPYQQLMGVLPDRSKSIVPTAYHDLMTNPNSPIIDFYPRDFELDMNGKKMEWEAVVKIPFIDEKRLLPAMKTKDHLLTKDEVERNAFGVALKFTYSPNVEFTYPSSMVGIFPELPHCHCVENIYELPTVDGLAIHVGLVEGVKLGVNALAGFPSINTLPHNGMLGFHGVNVFQQDSRNESMVVTIVESQERTKIDTAKRHLGKSVYVGYPFLSEAKVVRVSDELFDYALSQEGGPPLSIPHGPQEIDMWRRRAERLEMAYSKRLGMIIGQLESMVHVDTLKGLMKTEDGATIKEYAQLPGIETDFATQMVVDQVFSEDQRFLEKAALPIKEEFPEGTRAFFLGEFNYGRPLEIVRHIADKAEVWISTVKGKEREFGRDVAAEAERHSPYTPSFAVAKGLGLNPLVLSKITSSFQVMDGDTRVNLGLNLKFEAKKLKVLGYSRRGTTGWEFSDKAIELIRDYMIKFPPFIAGIQQNPQGNIYRAADFFPEGDAKEKIREIQSWLKSIESKHFEKVPLEAEQLDSEVVMKIEQAADNAVQTGPPVEGKKIKGVPRNALLKPSDAEQRLGNQQFSLGDRVVYVADSGRVPIATRGTVVGMTRTPRTTLLDVVFDVTFMSGTSLGDRCSPFRGSTVPVASVLNITKRQVITGSRAAESHRPQQAPRPLTMNGYGAPIGPNGQGQLRQANAPPALRGSFRGALSGHAGRGMDNFNRFAPRPEGGSNGTQGMQQQSLPVRNNLPNGTNSFRGRGDGAARGGPGRGRGGQPLNRTGYTRIDQGASDGSIRSNPDFKPQSYSNVPPPASLESRGRGRGRGGFQRGDGSRGRGAARGRGAVQVQQ